MKATMQEKYTVCGEPYYSLYIGKSRVCDDVTASPAHQIVKALNEMYIRQGKQKTTKALRRAACRVKINSLIKEIS
jgi:hypothetical protein